VPKVPPKALTPAAVRWAVRRPWPASATATAVVIGAQSTRPTLATSTAMMEPTIVSPFALSASGRFPSESSTMSGIAPPKYASASVLTSEPMWSRPTFSALA